MAYNPSLHPRGPDGKWISTGRRATRSHRPRNPTRSYVTLSTNPIRRTRGQGWAGLRANTVPYARVNVRGQTAGINTGTLIPGTHRRVAGGAYLRLEDTRRKTAPTRFAEAKGHQWLMTRSPKTRKVIRAVTPYLHNMRVSTTKQLRWGIPNPGMHGKGVRGAEVRIGTSRRAGPTVIIRRGQTKTPAWKSAKGIQSYNRDINYITERNRRWATTSRRKARPQRRRKARKRG